MLAACAADPGDSFKNDSGILAGSANASGPSAGTPMTATAGSSSATARSGAATSSVSVTTGDSATTSGSNTTGESTTTSGSTATGSGGATSSTSSSASSSGPQALSDSGAIATADSGAAGLPACPSGLEDKITTCDAGALQECVKGCGPDLPPGSSQSELGTKACTCTSGVYQCADCDYIDPLPTCYVEGMTPPACAADVADKLPCSTPCPPSTGNDVCTTVSDAGKSEGCVCITGSAGDVWTCATLPW